MVSESLCVIIAMKMDIASQVEPQFVLELVMWLGSLGNYETNNVPEYLMPVEYDALTILIYW